MSPEKAYLGKDASRDRKLAKVYAAKVMGQKRSKRSVRSSVVHALVSGQLRYPPCSPVMCGFNRGYREIHSRLPTPQVRLARRNRFQIYFNHTLQNGGFHCNLAEIFLGSLPYLCSRIMRMQKFG